MGRAKRGRKRDHVAKIVLASDICELSLGLILAMGSFHWQKGQSKQARERNLYDLLIHERTFSRLEARLKPLAEQIAPYTLNDSSQFRRPWGGEGTKGVIAYGNTDAFFSPAVRDFVKEVYSAPRLAWFQSIAAGLDNEFLQKVGQKAEIYTVSHVQAHAIAEWVLWAAFDFFGEGAARRRSQQDRKWQKVPFREVGETRWLIYGFGHIGENAGRRLKALGAHVTGVRRSSAVSPFADHMLHPDQLTPEDIVLADAVLFCCPLTSETENLGNADFFSAMSPGSLFLNVGRGPLVDEEALMAALDQGRPAHAALDVTRQEPLSPESPLWSHPAITLTAHTAPTTEGTDRRNDEQFLENLSSFLAGKPLRHEVDAAAFKAQSSVFGT